MKLRELINMPVFERESTCIIGRVDRAVVGDDFKLFYLVINIPGEEPKIIFSEDFQLTQYSIIIDNLRCIKSYRRGEELSIYERKLGDKVFNQEGKEIGTLSDFNLSENNKMVDGFEISAGTISDLLNGRAMVPLEDVCWKSPTSALITDERNDLNDH